jgi:hypothetical protein
MFNPGLGDTLTGAAIDQEHNGIMLTRSLHSLFGALNLYLEEVEVSVKIVGRTVAAVMADSYQGSPDTYRPHLSTRAPPQNIQLPDKIHFQNHDTKTHHSLPSRELLRFHTACAKILMMSGAGDRVDQIIMDGENIAVRGLDPNGTTILEDFWASRGMAALIDIKA